MKLTTIVAPSEIRRGTDVSFITILKNCAHDYYQNGIKYHLDMSDVIFMDSHGFRLIFDYLSVFPKITPPKDTHIIEMYNIWLDSKKGLTKNA